MNAPFFNTKRSSEKQRVMQTMIFRKRSPGVILFFCLSVFFFVGCSSSDRRLVPEAWLSSVCVDKYPHTEGSQKVRFEYQEQSLYHISEIAFSVEIDHILVSIFFLGNDGKYYKRKKLGEYDAWLDQSLIFNNKGNLPVYLATESGAKARLSSCPP